MGLKAETEWFIMAAQDQKQEYTRDYQARIIKNGADLIFRIYDQYDEIVDDLVSCYPVTRPTE